MEDKVEAARKMVAKAVLVTLSENLKRRGFDHLSSRVLETIPPEVGVGEIVIRDDVFKTEKNGKLELRLRASLVPREYAANVLVPAGYERTTREKFRMFTAAMECYWTEWCTNNHTLFKTICETLDKNGDSAPFALSTPEKIDCAMSARYWFADDTYWVGVIAYYVGSDGRLYISSKNQ